MGDKLDMALDDIIKTTKGGSRGRGGRSAGASGGRGRGSARGSGRGGRGSGGSSRAPMSNGAGRSGMTAGRWSHDMYQGSGAGRMAPQSMGPVKLNISNLDYGVTDSDIRELFQEFGDMRAAAVHYDRSGCSLGSAQVIFGRRSDAMKAMQQYNGVHLDGRPMKIFIEGDMGASGGRGGRMGGGPMVKRLQGSRPEPLIPRLGGGRGRGSSGGGGGRSAGGRGGRGGKGGDKAKPKTAEELDAELDNYLTEAKKTKA